MNIEGRLTKLEKRVNVVKAKDVKMTPEYIARAHALGLLRSLVLMYPKESAQIIQQIVVEEVKITVD